MTSPKITKAEQQIAKDQISREDPTGALLIQAILSAAPDKVKRRYRKIFKGQMKSINPSALVHVAIAQLLMLSLDSDIEVRDKVKLSTALIESIRKITERFELQSAEPVAIFLQNFTTTTTAELEQGIEFGK
tara:strand:- start:2852 stop:3247 length:396 start_codon:yes stop_codon:yes gene_type:complete